MTMEVPVAQVVVVKAMRKQQAQHVVCAEVVANTILYHHPTQAFRRLVPIYFAKKRH